ncbi:MAG: PLP-dependent aminotransferase family protein, partial [Clostridia bacterium]|nr:PLP-dependent aminotransferase family protein [Clostridia bacterium]
NKYISDKVGKLKASAIREMFKLMADPEIISLAGGSPDSSLFPANELAEIAKDILTNEPVKALQYGTTDGYAPFKEQVLVRASKIGCVSDGDKVIITTGEQQGIDLAVKTFVNEGEGVAVEEPSFVGSLNSIRAHNARLVPVPMEADGINTEAFEEILKSTKIKLLYVIPTFQNPTGITMSLEKRKKLIELASKYDFLILEDNPYGDLRFKGEDIPTIKSLDIEGRVIYCSSFSKILSPGLRLGYVICNGEVIDRIEIAKQANDVHTPFLTQMIASEYLKKYDIDENIKKAREIYGKKCSFMLECMEKYFPASVTWTKPEGGLFIMCTAPAGTDIDAILKESLKNKVAFVAGSGFMTDQEKPCTMFRLNYSTMPLEKIEKGIKSLGEVLCRMIKE